MVYIISHEICTQLADVILCIGSTNERWRGNVISHWLRPYTEWSLIFIFFWVTLISSWLYHIMYLPISIRVTSQALGQSNDCPSACAVTLTDMDKKIIIAVFFEVCAMGAFYTYRSKMSHIRVTEWPMHGTKNPQNKQRHWNDVPLKIGNKPIFFSWKRITDPSLMKAWQNIT